jgi:hypothetical protein
LEVYPKQIDAHTVSAKYCIPPPINKSLAGRCSRCVHPLNVRVPTARGRLHRAF